jgi:CO dehydrogenase maturation factor
MKIAITGKGGVGKTTLAAMLARVLRDEGKRVTLVDADPDMNLAAVMNVPVESVPAPVIELKELIAERTGTRVGEPAPFFTMNPRVDDIPGAYCREHEGLRLLVMGTVHRGGGGCACPENAFLKSLLSHLMIAEPEWVILDMVAGVEHLGRGTALGVDLMLVVVEASVTSIETAHRVRSLAADIGIRNVRVVANRIRSPEELSFIAERLGPETLLRSIDYSPEILRVNTGEISALHVEGPVLDQVRDLARTIIEDAAPDR